MDGSFLAQLRERIGFVAAIAVTVVWVAVVALYLKGLGWFALMALPLVQLAALLLAAAGPVGVLWLFMGALEQRCDINHIVNRLGEMLAHSRQTVQQAEAQTRALIQLHAQSVQAQSAQGRALAMHDLAANAAILAERLGVLNRDALIAAWSRYGAGDITTFVQAFLTFAVTHPEISERLAEAVGRDGVARAALAAYVRRYEHMGKSLVEDKAVREIVEEGALGRAYRLFKAADELVNRGPAAVHELSQEPQARLDTLAQRLEAAAPTN